METVWDAEEEMFFTKSYRCCLALELSEPGIAATLGNESRCRAFNSMIKKGSGGSCWERPGYSHGAKRLDGSHN